MNLLIIVTLMVTLQCSIVRTETAEILSRSKRREVSEDFLDQLTTHEDNDDLINDTDEDVALPIRLPRSAAAAQVTSHGNGYVKQAVNDDARLMEKLQRLFKEIQKRSLSEDDGSDQQNSISNTHIENDKVESGSGESGSGQNEDNGSPGTINGTYINKRNETIFQKLLQKADSPNLIDKDDDDFSALFNSGKISKRSLSTKDASDDAKKERRKRFVDDDDEQNVSTVKKTSPYFEGLPETLATIFDISKPKRDIPESHHLNPRALILKRQARDKVVPNIPLPFNRIHDTVETESKDPIMKAKRFVKKIKDQKNKSDMNTTKRDLSAKTENMKVGKEEKHDLKTRKEEREARSAVGSIGDEQEERPTIKQTKNKTNDEQSIMRGARSTGEEIATDNSKPHKNDIYTKTIPFEELKSLDIVKRALTDDQFNRLRFLDEEKAKSLFESDEGNFIRNLTHDGIYYDTRNKRFLLSADATRLAQFTKNLTDSDSHNSPEKESTRELAALKSNITKRDVIMDTDPDIVQKMGGIDEKVQKDEMDKAKEVYRFAREVLDIVGDLPKGKSKRHVAESKESPIPVKGVWTALGSSPEFVPGLIKRDYIEKPKPEKRKQMTLKEIRQKRAEADRRFSAIKDAVKGKHEKQHVSKRSKIVHEHIESPVSITETGTLGSVNFQEDRTDGTVEVDTSSKTKKTKSKRHDLDSEVDINHMSSPQSADGGKVIFAFDEVKEMMPARRYVSLDEETRLEPQSVTESRYDDVDKELADSMLVSRQNIPSAPVTARLMESTQSPGDSSGFEMKNRIPSLLKKEDRLGPAQISKYRAEHEQPKMEEMKKWLNETMIQPISNDQTAETDAALQKLNLESLNVTYPGYKDNKGETSSQYMAKNLEDKIKSDDKYNQIDVDELQRDILKEQQKYRLYLEAKRLERLKEQQQNNDLETQTQSTQELNPYLPTPIGKPANTSNELEHFQRVHDQVAPTVKQNNNNTSVPFNESALEHFERVHGYNSFQNNSIQPTAPPVNSTTPTPITSTLTTVNLTSSTIPSSTIATTTTSTTTTKTSTTTPTTISNTLATTIATATPNSTNATSTTPATTVSPTLSTTTITLTTTPHSASTNYTESMNRTSPETSHNYTSLPMVIPVLESNNTLYNTTSSQKQVYYQQPVAQQYLTNWQNQANNSETREMGLPTTAATNQSPLQPLQQVATTKLPYPLDYAYQPEIVLPKNKSAPVIAPRTNGYIGCYVDRLIDGRDLPVRAGLPSVTPNNCRNVCKKTGFKYAAVQYGYLCFCGNMYGKYDVVPDNECNTICSGDSRYTCGGLWRNKVYSTEGAKAEESKSYKDENGVTRSVIPLQSDDPRKALEEAEQKDYNLQYEVSQQQQEPYGEKLPELTDDEWLKLAKNKASKEAGSPKQTSDSNKKKVETFIKQHAADDFKILKQSPNKHINIIEGTRLFRGTIKLQQIWYDDFAKPESTKYQILTGNIEKAMNNLFGNDTSYVFSDVISLKEADQLMPHRTVADFVIVFFNNKTDDVTHTLFELVKTTKQLNGMPVLPHTLKIKEFLTNGDDENGASYTTQSSVTNQQYQGNQNQPMFKHDSIIHPNFSPTFAQASPWDTVVRSDLGHIDEETVNLLQQQSSAVQAFANQATKSFANSAKGNNVAPSYSTQEQASELQNFANPMTSSNIAPSYSTQEQATELQNFANPVTSNNVAPSYSTQQQASAGRTFANPSANNNMAPVFPGQQHAFVNPIASDNIAELKNYMEYQKLAPELPKKNNSVNPTGKNQMPTKGDQNKPQYLLRMFFWKDMLARRKRENKVDSRISDIKILKKKIIPEHNITPIKSPVNTTELTINRRKRSQADDRWPISYKGDAQKHAYKDNSQYLKRRKRIVLDEDKEDSRYLKRRKRVVSDDDVKEENMNFSILFRKIDSKAMSKTDNKKKRDTTTTNTNEQKQIDTNIKIEEPLRRSKRTDED